MKALELFENVDVAPLGIFASATAAGAGDNTAVLAAAGFDTRDVHSLVLVTHCLHTLTAAKTLSLAIRVQESDDNSAFDAATVLLAATVVATGVSTNGETVHELKVDLRGLLNRKRYLKFEVTPDLSNTATDTCTIRTMAVTAGARVKPVTH